MDEYIKDNIHRIRARIDSSASRAGREPDSVRLLAATKNRIVPEILEAIAAGITLVGENKVQELLEKEPLVHGEAEVHFIGHLQRNKVRQVVGRVELIHSLDSIRLAEAIDARAGSMGAGQEVLVQVNVAAEESKSGVQPEQLEEFIGELGRLESVKPVGLSTIAPLDEDPEGVRWVFKRLRELTSEMDARFEWFTGRELSMGMTNDFEVAVEEGSTIVRIGTAIFGPRSRTL